MATCCNFTTDIPPGTVLDPHKRVRHFTGLVMGAEEFQQDQLYLMARDELHQRALHGYGVVSGLGVTVRPDPDTGAPEVVVAAGMGVNPRGESICVPQAQCGNLNDWLQTNRDELLGSPPSLLPGSVTLYLVLCARDCETDQVPVLGDPCRTLEDATAASRIADDFEICLRLERPQQLEEEAVRELGELLRSIEVSDAAGGLSPAQLADLVRGLAPSGSPPQVGQIDPAAGSPPLPLLVHPDDAAEALAAVYRVWIQEVRPALNPETGTCEIPRDADDGRCLLLACLEVGYDEIGGNLEVSGDVEIDTGCGPILVQTRVLQELLLAGLGLSVAAPLLGSPLAGPGGAPDVGGSPPAVAPISHSDLLDLDADDHDQYLLVDTVTRGLVTELPAGGNVISGLGEPGAPAGDEAVRWNRAVKVGDAAGGDLSGTYPDPQVAALQNNPVAPGALGAGNTGNVLTWDGNAWQAQPMPFEQSLTQVIGLSWRHGGGSLLEINHNGNLERGLAIGFGIGGVPSIVQSRTLNNNTFRVFLRTVPPPGGPFGAAVFEIFELRPRQVVPVDVTLAGGLISQTTGPANPTANGVLFLLDPNTADLLTESRIQLFIELAGDHVLDRSGRAIDSEFPRSTLPSGDRPGSGALGIQGGVFSSWVTAGLVQIVIDGRDINVVDVNVLMELPGIGDRLAERIVAAREARGGFDSLEDLSELPRMTAAVLNNLRRLLQT